MKEFRKQKVWEDYWCFEPIDYIAFDILGALDYYCWKPKKDKAINVRLESFSDIEKPNENQIKALEFVIRNESNILGEIWNYYKNLVLPIYSAAIDIEEKDIAMNQSELSKVFGVKSIEIPPFENSDSVYFLIEFDFKYDCEHGLYFLFKNDKPIDLFSEGDKDYEAIDLYEKGLYNNDKTPLKFRIGHMNGELVFEGEYYYDHVIQFKLLKGPYRVFYTINNSNRGRNFFVTEDLDNFTLDYVFKNCESKNNYTQQ